MYTCAHTYMCMECKRVREQESEPGQGKWKRENKGNCDKDTLSQANLPFKPHFPFFETLWKNNTHTICCQETEIVLLALFLTKSSTYLKSKIPLPVKCARVSSGITTQAVVSDTLKNQLK